MGVAGRRSEIIGFISLKKLRPRVHKYLPKTVTESNLREIEDRYTRFDSNSTTKQEGDTSFVQIKATEEGSKIALVASGTGEKTIGFKIRTNGVAKLEMSYSINDTLTLPDTKGQWRYVTYKMNDLQGFGDLAYLTVKGAGTTVDIDHINCKRRITADAAGIPCREYGIKVICLCRF